MGNYLIKKTRGGQSHETNLSPAERFTKLIMREVFFQGKLTHCMTFHRCEAIHSKSNIR
jgi:hypothetical protein